MPEAPEETIDYCQSCGLPMDVSTFAPFSNVECPSCGQHSRVKVKFGPYTLSHRHAIGGMSMVFVAHDDMLDREVAVKILSEEYSNDEKRILAFEHEAKITASLSHPNIVRVLRTGKAFGRFYIAMELVTGGHYEHHIRERGRIPEAELLPLAIEVAQGLKAAQAAGLIHRDVKPGNILLDEEGHAKLVDFGLALVTQDGKATATEFWATPFYVPPETVQGLEEDFRSDIYALGATLYHALAGTPPCNEVSMSTTKLLKAKQEIQPLQRVAPDISARTCALIDRAMAFHPQQRFSSYDEMIRLLQSAHKHLGREGPASRRTPLNKMVVMTVVGVMGAAAAVALLWPDGGEPPAKAPGPAAGDGVATPEPGEAAANPAAEISQAYLEARQALRDGKFREAADAFAALADNPEINPVSRSWAGVEATVARYLSGNAEAARAQAARVSQTIATIPPNPAGVGDDIRSTLAELDKLPPASPPPAGTPPGARQAVAAMLAGLKNWEQGLLDPAADCFRLAATLKLPAEEQWAAIYQKLASDYLADHHLLNGPLFDTMPQTPEGCRQALAELDGVLESLHTRGRARFNVRAWQLDIARQAKLLGDQAEARK